MAGSMGETLSAGRVALQNAINLQLLGGIWILQTFPAIVAGLFTRWFHRWALLAGWAVAMGYGTYRAYTVANPRAEVAHFGGSTDAIPLVGHLGYIGITACALNLLVAVVLTLVLRAARVPDGRDRTRPADYFADDKELMKNPPPVLVDLHLDPYVLNVLPRSLVPAVGFVAVVAAASFFLARFAGNRLQAGALSDDESKKRQ